MNVLRALEQQSYPPDEVIVVIDGSTDNTRALLDRNSFRFQSFRIIEQENGGRAKVRNRGAQEAKGELLVFFDDDMRPAPDCLSIHIMHHEQFAESILTGAQLEEKRKNTSDFQNFKADLSNKWYQTYLNEPHIKTEEQVFLTAANFSIATHLFKSLGGFDERLTDAEDYDFGRRAFAAGIPMYVKPEAHAWHDDPISCRKYIDRQKQYKAAHQLLRQLKPDLYLEKNKYLPPTPTGWKLKSFKVFAHPAWITMIDRQSFLFLPKKIRYKLYDIVVTAHSLLSSDKSSN